MTTPPTNSDFVRVPTDEYLALQRQVESLRGEVERAKQERNSEGVKQRNFDLPQITKTHAALRKSKVALQLMLTASKGFQRIKAYPLAHEAIASIKEAGVE